MNDEGVGRQRCAGCDRPTEPGTPEFVDRRVVRAAQSASGANVSYLCAQCQEQLHLARKTKKLSDAELRALIENGSVAGMTYAGAGDMTPFSGGG